MGQMRYVHEPESVVCCFFGRGDALGRFNGVQGMSVYAVAPQVG